MRHRRWTALICALAFLVVAAPATAQAGTHAARARAELADSRPRAAGGPDQRGPRVEPEVLDELAHRPTTDFWVVFERRADLSGADKIKDWTKRGRYVHDRLVDNARASQAGLTRTLTARSVRFEPYWIANRVLVRGGDRQMLNTALAQDGVARIQADEPVKLPHPIKGTKRASAGAAEWGVKNIRADRVWSALGDRGKGVVVGNIDSGVQFDHPALINQYRGNLGGGKFDHAYNWWDPSRVCPTAEPCDNSSHGTHTMGTMVGDDGAGNGIGVAPEARWITAKGCESTTCTQRALLSSGQFMLAPTDLAGGAPRPELRPQVVNNSWSGASGSGFYDDLVNAWVAAGMFPVFSNGNSGPACSTSGSPGDGSTAYSVGAYDSGNAIATFSSRGPGRNGAVKPNISAPGVNVRSSVPGNGYASFSGTSMSAPHLAGAVALMWSAAPELAGDVPSTRAALDLTAIDTEDLTCGGTPENNGVYGQGRLDALGATLRVAGDAGISGRITDAASGAAIPNARVRVLDDDQPFSITTDTDGRYRLNLLPGSYDVEISRFGYRPLTVSDVAVKAGKVATADATLKPLPTGTITGRVTLDESRLGVPGATIHAGDVPLTTTGADGAFRVTAPIGTYEVAARHDMFRAPDPEKVTVAEGKSVAVNFALRCGEECNIKGLWTDRYDGPAGGSDIARAMELSPDGGTMFVTGESPGSGTGSDMATIAYDPATGKRRWEARYDGPGHGSDAGYGIGRSPDGATVYVTGPSTGVDKKTQYVTVAYESATGKKRWEARYDGPGTGDDSALALAVSPDGAKIVVTGLSDDVWNDYATVAYNATTGDQLWVARYDGPAKTTDTATSVKFAPNGETVHVTGYSVGKNRDDVVTIAYDRATGRELWVARHDGPAHGLDMGFALDVSPDGSAVYVTGRSDGVGTKSDYVTIAYDTQTGNQRWAARFDGPAKGDDIAQDVQVSPDGSAVFVSGHSLGVGTNADYATVKYDAATGAQLWSARYNGPANSFDGANALRVSPDSGRVFVTGHSFGIGTNREYATIAYDAAAKPELPVFVPSELRVQPGLAVSDDKVRVSVNVTNVGSAAGDHDAALRMNGKVEETTKVTLRPGETRRIDWTVTPGPGRYEISVGRLTVPLQVVGCDQTITGTRREALAVTKGVTCLAEGAQVVGPVDVRAGAGLVSTGAKVSGPVKAVDAAIVMLRESEITGPVTVTGTTGGVALSGNQVTGNVSVNGNTTDGLAIVVAGNRIVGPLACAGNTPPPINQEVPNKVTGQATGQCAGL